MALIFCLKCEHPHDDQVKCPVCPTCGQRLKAKKSPRKRAYMREYMKARRQRQKDKEAQ